MAKTKSKTFHIEFLNPAQKFAYGIYQQHEIIFLLGPAGTGKTHLAAAFAIKEVLEKTKRKIVLTRPIVEAGESLGYLPGTFEEKVNPYILPVFDCFHKMLGNPEEGFEDFCAKHVEIAPLAYMRGRTFDDSVCIFDEAQNATKAQLKLFLTRFGKNSKIIITGDPKQSDIHTHNHETPLMDIVSRVEVISGIGVVRFGEESIVRHPLVGEILRKLEA
jgi:phosphate starvation-inducible PhoH-like protein